MPIKKDMTLDKLISELQTLKDNGLSGDTLVYAFDNDGNMSCKITVVIDNDKDVFIDTSYKWKNCFIWIIFLNNNTIL